MVQVSGFRFARFRCSGERCTATTTFYDDDVSMTFTFYADDVFTTFTFYDDDVLRRRRRYDVLRFYDDDDISGLSSGGT